MPHQRERHEKGAVRIRRNHGNNCPQTIVQCAVATLRLEIPNCPGKWAEKLAYGCANLWRWDGGRPSRLEWFFFSEAAHFWQWLATKHRRKRSVWFCSHGMGRLLTLLQFWDELDARRYRLHEADHVASNKKEAPEERRPSGQYTLCTADPPTIVLAEHNGHFLHCVDLRNYFNISKNELADLAKMERLPAPEPRAGCEAWDEWLRREVQIERKVLHDLFAWWLNNDMGVFRYTASALAFAHFRHKHLREPILSDDCDEARQTAREALTAGECRLFYCGAVVDPLTYSARCQERKSTRPFRLRKGPIYVFDVNSLYPFVMRDNLFPRELVCFKDQASLEDIRAWRKTLCLIASVELETPEQPFPIVLDNKVWYATGRYWTTLAGPELFAALDAGYVRNVRRLVAYYPGRLFTSYVDALYPRKVWARKTGDVATEGFIKMLLNGLAGKFAQRSPEWEWSADPGNGNPWGHYYKTSPGNTAPKQYRVISGYVQQEGDRLDVLYSNPAITAYINSYARVHMHTVRQKVGDEHVFYQDTDSLHLDSDGAARLARNFTVDNDQLGAFRLEGEYTRGEYRGPKDYTLDDHHVVSGMKPDARLNGRKAYVQVEGPSLDTLLSVEPSGVIVYEEVAKSMSRYHPRGILTPDGSVKPAIYQDHHLYLTLKAFAEWQYSQASKRTQAGLPF